MATAFAEHAPAFNSPAHYAVNRATRNQSRISDAADRVAKEAAEPDFEGWSEFHAGADSALHTMIIEHSYSVWAEDCLRPSADDMDEVRYAWSVDFPEQAAACAVAQLEMDAALAAIRFIAQVMA